MARPTRCSRTPSCPASSCSGPTATVSSRGQAPATSAPDPAGRRRPPALGTRRRGHLMRPGPRRALTAAAVACVLLTGCSSTVTGSASPGGKVPTDATDADLSITAAQDDPEDVSARNALVDLDTFWGQAFPEAFGEPFQPLQGGYFSVDSANLDESAYPSTGIGCAREPDDPRDVEFNAQ